MSRTAEWAVGCLTRGVIAQNQWHNMCWLESSLWDEHWKRCIHQLPSVNSCNSAGWHHWVLYFRHDRATLMFKNSLINLYVQTCNYSFKKIRWWLDWGYGCVQKAGNTGGLRTLIPWNNAKVSFMAPLNKTWQGGPLYALPVDKMWWSTHFQQGIICNQSDPSLHLSQSHECVRTAVPN